MKTLLILIVLIILTIVAGEAQTTKKCDCKKVIHKSISRHAKGYAANKTTPPKFTNRTHDIGNETVPGTYRGNEAWQSEYSEQLSKQDEDYAGYQSENTYTGQYPAPTIQYTRISRQEASYKGSKHSDLCLWNCR